MTDRDDTPAAPYRPFATFAVIWGVTALAHQLAFTFWTESWQGWLLVFAAIAVIFHPGCVLRFGVLVVCSLLNLWHKLPFVPNHILYEGMLHVIMLIALGTFLWSASGRREFTRVQTGWSRKLLLFTLAATLKILYFVVPGVPHGYLLGAITTLFLLVAFCRLLFGSSPEVGSGDDFYARFAPVIRAAVVIMYFWAAIQKLNWDYLNPDVSCAALLHTEIAAYFGELVPTKRWALHGAIWASYAFEFGIPVLLCFRRTRFIGFLAAVFFHLWLAIHPAAGIFSFSSLILALLALFLPVGWGARLQDIWRRQLNWLGNGDIDKGRKIARWTAVFGFFTTLIIQGTLYITVARSYQIFEIANRVGFFAFFAWGCWIGACYLLAARTQPWNGGPLPNRAKPSLVWIGLIPIFLNGTYPWLGGRTQTSFSMYSNLRSEGEGNHIFFERYDLFRLQTDMVEVVASTPNILAPGENPRGIQQFANIGHRFLPYFEFRRLVSEMSGDFHVTYRRNGEESELGRRHGEVYGDTEAFRPLPLLKRKLLWFRRLESIDGPMSCTH